MSRPTRVVTGVYTITNRVTGKLYVGSTVGHISERFRQHRYQLRKGSHANKHLQAAWNRYGEPEFDFEVLDPQPPEFCVSAEQYWINMLLATNPRFGYNAKPVAASQLGYRHTESTLRKLSVLSSSWKRSKEHIAALCAGRVACGYSMKGKPLSKEHRQKIRISLMGNTNAVGAIKSDAARKKLSTSLTGVPKSAEHRANISAARKGIVFSAETRARMSEAAKARGKRAKELRNAAL